MNDMKTEFLKIVAAASRYERQTVLCELGQNETRKKLSEHELRSNELINAVRGLPQEVRELLEFVG